MRVLHLGKYYPPVPGGMERVLQLLCEGERRSIDSRVLVANTRARTEVGAYRGVPVTRAAAWGTLGSVAVCPAFALELRRSRPDLLVLHEPNPVALVSDLVAGHRGPLVVYFHSEVVRPAWKYRLVYRPFLARVLDRADRILVASPAMAERAEQLATHRGKCEVVPYGIDTSPFAATPEVLTRAAALRAAWPAFTVLFAGRLVPYKGVDVLLHAVARTSAGAVIVGDGPLQPELRRLAARLGLHGRVHFAGAVTDAELALHYHACDAFVLPSLTRAEAFGMVQLEAMACGKPVISTRLESGVPWVNQHDVTGLTVAPGDADALARAIQALAADPGRRVRLGQQGRLRVDREFTADVMAARTVAVYRRIVQLRKAA